MKTHGSLGRRLGPPLLIAAALLVAYSNAWHTAYVFDDHRSILGNPVVVSEPAWRALVAPGAGLRGGETLSTRPVSAFSFALNYRLTGSDIAGFRAVNLLIHLASAWLLFALLRRTFTRCGAAPLRRDGFWLATAIALLWAVHPLQTSVVTYTVQRAEGLAGFFYLATLACFLCAVDARDRRSPGAGAWVAAALLSCLAGMASKEIVASAPLTVLLYDRVFVSGSFREAWRRHGRWHVALFSCEILLVFLALHLSFQNETIGSYLGTTPLTYPVSQAYYLCRYVFLVFWPGPLVFDYGFAPVLEPGWLLPCAALVLGAIALTVVAWRRAPGLAFLGIVFFAILSVTSSVVPIAGQIAAEHRMYLPSLVPITLAVLLLHRLLAWRPRGPAVGRVALALLLVAFATAAVARTWTRNRSYESPLSLWEDTVRGAPGNVRALTELAKLHRDEAEKTRDPATREAVLRRGLELADRAVAIDPEYGLAFNSRGAIRLLLGDREGALADFETAIAVFPGDPRGYINRGRMLHLVDPRAADADYTRALELGPAFVRAAINRGALRHGQGRLELALADFDHAIRYQPDNAMAWHNRGVVLAQLGRSDEAIASHRRALELYEGMAFQPGVEDARAALESLQGRSAPAAVDR